MSARPTGSCGSATLLAGSNLRGLPEVSMTERGPQLPYCRLSVECEELAVRPANESAQRDRVIAVAARDEQFSNHAHALVLHLPSQQPPPRSRARDGRVSHRE